MPKRKTPVEKPKDQFKRFVEVAKEHQVEDASASVDDAFRRIAKKKASSKQ